MPMDLFDLEKEHIDDFLAQKNKINKYINIG